MKISVCIPTYEMGGRGAAFLSRALESVKLQTVKDLEIVVSDHSEDDCIQKLCIDSDLSIKYLRKYRHDTNYQTEVKSLVKRL